jgi:hypothetical protein
MADSDKNLPAPPYKSQFIGSNGLLSEPWSKWVRQLFQRVGGFSALSNSELADSSVTQDEIDDLEAIVVLNNTNALSLINDLNQGRHL